MASLTIPNIFTAGTPALASEVNANFTAVVNWSTGLDQDNMATFTGDLAFTIANGNAIVIQNNGNDESIKITQGALLGAGKASILITDNQTQTNANAAELKMVLAAGATIPAIHVTHAAVDTFKLTSSQLTLFNNTTTLNDTYLRLEVLLKPPVRTTSQRNAIVSPEEGSLLYNSTNHSLEVKNNTKWESVGSPIGSMVMFAGNSAPIGWLLCQGQEVSQSTYADLYSIVSSTFNTGGEAVGNFRLPDMRRKVPMGAGGSVPAGAPVNNNTVGSTGGTETVTLSVSEMPAHTHTTTNSGTAGGAYTNPALRLTWTSDSSFINTYTTSSTGGSAAHSNTQPSLVLNYIIKY